MTNQEINEIMQEQQRIMEVYKKDKFIVNDHNSGTEHMPISDWAVVRLYEYDHAGNLNGLDLCPVAMFTFVTCLNPLYIGKDGHVHLSTCSVGGNLWNLDIDRYNREFSADNNDGYHVIQRVELIYDPEEDLVKEAAV